VHLEMAITAITAAAVAVVFILPVRHFLVALVEVIV
jgi:hypothetical protein